MEELTGVYRRLEESGYNVAYAWTSEIRPVITSVAATVHLQHKDATSTVIAVGIYCNIGRGGNGWVDIALDMLDALEGCGFTRYALGPCSFDADCGCLKGELTLTWKTKSEDGGSSSGGSSVTYIPMKMGAVELHHVTKFTANRPSGLSTWEWRLEELFPGGQGEETLPAEPFSLTRGKDAYHSCRVTSCERRWSSGNLIQIKEGTSTGRTTIA